ncbi:MAG: lysophospholipid acyltransferase family protein [Bacilli bacterium]
MIKYIIAIFTVVPILFFDYFAWILRYSLHPKKYPIEVRFAKVQKLAKQVLKFFRVKVNLETMNKYNDLFINSKESHLIVSNHLSDADPIIFMAYSKRPISFVAKIESKKFLFVGKIVKILDGEFLDRSNIKQQFKVMESIKDKLTYYKGLDFVIFPEGTRNKNPDIINLLEFKNGAFHPAVKAMAPISVFALYGTNDILSFKSKKHINEIEINYIDTFYYDRYKNYTTYQLADLSSKLIKEAINNDRKLDKNQISIK